jgi:hypothetical protein
VGTQAPVFNEATENCNQINPEFKNGEWLMAWEISPASTEEIQERFERKSAEVRFERNNRLANCDWTQLPDAPADRTTWASYRQALRDISDQAGFPWEIVWPEEP